MSKVTKVGTTFTEEDTTIIDSLTVAVTAPFKSFSTDSTTYYSEEVVGRVALAHLSLGIFIGDVKGDKIPVLGGRRGQL